MKDYSRLPGPLPTIYFVLPVMYEGFFFLVSYERGRTGCDCTEVAVDEEVKAVVNC